MNRTGYRRVNLADEPCDGVSPRRGTPTARVILQPGDLYVTSGEVRRHWDHGIPYALEDEFRGTIYPRAYGVSVTWRLLPDLSRS